MTRSRNLNLILVLILLAIGSTSLTAGPARAADSWSFTGAVTAVERGSTEVTVKGDITAPSSPSGIDGSDSGFTPTDWHNIRGICLVREGAAEPRYIDVFNHSDRRCRSWIFPRLPNYWYGVTPGSTHFIEWTLNAVDGPGTFVFKFFDERNTATPQTLPGVAPISIVGELSRAPTTKLHSPPSVVKGEQLTFSAVFAVTWSDGVTTEEAPVDASVKLQVRQVGTSEWRTLSTKSPFTGTVNDSFEARYLINGEVSAPVLITAIKPTAQSRFSSLKASAGRVYLGSPLSLEATMDTLYTDSQWRPTPKQTVKVQFSTRAGGGWVDVSNAWIVDGAARKNVIPAKSGYWRFATGGATSKSVYVRVIAR